MLVPGLHRVQVQKAACLSCSLCCLAPFQLLAHRADSNSYPSYLRQQACKLAPETDFQRLHSAAWRPV